MPVVSTVLGEATHDDVRRLNFCHVIGRIYDDTYVLLIPKQAVEGSNPFARSNT